MFISALVLRVWAIAVPLNADEAKWLSRGVLFWKGLLAGNLAETYQSPHPGVPNMWLSGLGMLINCQLSQIFPDLFAAHQPNELGACTETLPFAVGLYILPRLLQAIATSACMAAFYVLTRRLMGGAIALIATVLLLLEPFFLGYQRFITTDAPHADLGSLSLLLFLLYLRQGGSTPRRPTRRLLVASGVLMGGSVAAKIIALFAVPAVGLWAVLTELGLWTSRFPRQGWRRRSIEMGIWVAALLVALVVIWPALWLQPGYTLNRLSEALLEESGRGYFFFQGELTHAPGPMFYLVAIALRLSPWLQLGCLACLVTLLIPHIRRQLSIAPDLLALGLATLWFVGCLSVSTTKLDRYLSFVIPLLAILAAAGWSFLAVAVRSHLQTRLPPVYFQWPVALSVGVATGLGLGQMVFLLPHFPYCLTYFNPLWGGSAAAQQLIMVGQGEGLDQTAAWLNPQLQPGEPPRSELPPSQREMTVASWHRSVLAAYFHGKSLLIPQDELPDRDFWEQAHRIVFYQNQLQRQLPSPEFIQYFAAQPPLHSVRLHGIDYAVTYAGPVPLAADLAHIQYPVSANGANVVDAVDAAGRAIPSPVRLLGYDLDQPTDGSQSLTLTLYWQTRRRLRSDTRVRIEVGDRQQPIFQTTQPILGGFYPGKNLPPEQIWRDVHPLAIAPELITPEVKIHIAWQTPE
ncbi:MAG: phospholipid carrier-dependent glycosyltransferase [Synechococcales bacterium]|nr:phospholipid carrier-dependent glycosyltransferase [Synechococcales bacterium]